MDRNPSSRAEAGALWQLPGMRETLISMEMRILGCQGKLSLVTCVFSIEISVNSLIKEIALVATAGGVFPRQLAAEKWLMDSQTLEDWILFCPIILYFECGIVLVLHQHMELMNK